MLPFRDKSLRNAQYFFLTDWTGGKYCSPGMDGSRSGGLLAATWASMVAIGRDGYLRYGRRRSSPPPTTMQDAVRSHPELRIIGSPTFCFSFTSDEFDIYHVNDFMRLRGWRFNGQQYPNAIHMAVTRPQTQPGVAETFAADLAEAVAYAVEHKDEPAGSARDLRRRRRRPDRRGRRVHPGRHGRHDGHPAVGAPGLTRPTQSGLATHPRLSAEVTAGRHFCGTERDRGLQERARTTSTAVGGSAALMPSTPRSSSRP